MRPQYLPLLLTLTACGPGVDPNVGEAAPIVQEKVIQVVVESSDLIDSVDYGITWWGEDGNSQLVRVDSCDDAAACVHVRWMTAEERESINQAHAGHDVGGLTNGGRTLVVMNSDLTLGYLPTGALQVSVTHELGHVQGFVHVPEVDDLMYVQPTFKGTICIAGKVCRDF